MTTFLKRSEARFRYRFKQWLGRKPLLYHWCYRLRGGYADRLVTPETDLCIEGFPRSANSFAVREFEFAQDGSISIAHHNHAPAPALNAVQEELPTIVLIRDPVDAVISFRGLQMQKRARSGTSVPLLAVSFKAQLGAWISFYERLASIRNRIVIAPFETVINDFGQVVQAVNIRFDTDFASFEHTVENVQAIREEHGYHVLPTKKRNELKREPIFRTCRMSGITTVSESLSSPESATLAPIEHA